MDDEDAATVRILEKHASSISSAEPSAQAQTIEWYMQIINFPDGVVKRARNATYSTR